MLEWAGWSWLNLMHQFKGVQRQLGTNGWEFVEDSVNDATPDVTGWEADSATGWNSLRHFGSLYSKQSSSNGSICLLAMNKMTGLSFNVTRLARTLHSGWLDCLWLRRRPKVLHLGWHAHLSKVASKTTSPQSIMYLVFSRSERTLCVVITSVW